jgi:hypothetical protein
MRSPSRTSRLAIAALSAVAGCSSQPVPAGRVQLDSAELAVGRCAYVFERFFALNCSVSALSRAAEQVRLAPGETARRRFRAMLDARCAPYADSGPRDETAEDAPPEALRAKVDACVEDMDRRIAAATRAREERLAKVRPRAAAVKADERYAPLRDRLAVLARDARAAREAADAARLERRWNAAQYETAETAAARALEAAIEERDALLREHGIEPDDARDLGLF